MPPIYIGDRAVTKRYVGDRPVISVFVGDKQVLSSANFYYIPANGQSLSIGDKGTPVVHTSETFGDTVSLFNGLPPMGLGFEVVPTGAEFASLVNYKETSKETNAWSMFNWLNAKGLLTDRWLYAAYGIGGKTIAELTDDPDPTGWGWNKAHMGNTAAKVLTPAGYQFTVPFTTWIHGEADSANDQAAYKTKLRAYHDRLMSDTGKTFPMLMDQTGKLGSIDIATTALQYTLDNSDAVMVLPKYWLNRLYYGDSIRLHLSPTGYNIQGEYFGRAAEKLLNGESYGALYPQSWSIDSTFKKLTVNFNVPGGGNLVVDTATLPSAPALGMGVTRPTFSQEAAASYIQTGNSIEWTFAEPLTTDSVLNLGNTLSDAANNNGVILPCINIRDDSNDDSLYVAGLKLWNWCCQKKWMPTKLVGALDRFIDNLWLYGDLVVSGWAASTIIAGRSTEWLLRGMTQCSVSFDATISAGSATFWCGNNSKAVTNGSNTLTGNITTIYRLYAISGSGGFSGSITNINVRFVA